MYSLLLYTSSSTTTTSAGPSGAGAPGIISYKYVLTIIAQRDVANVILNK